MDVEHKLRERSGSVCELCSGTEGLQAYKVPPVSAPGDNDILVCNTCLEQIHDPGRVDADHWWCLNTSMWSNIPAVQVVAWRLLSTLRHEGWPQDLLDMLYLDDETLAWAKAAVGETDSPAEEAVIHKDSNGAVLQACDTVVLIKDLDVKGGGVHRQKRNGRSGSSNNLIHQIRREREQKHRAAREHDHPTYFLSDRRIFEQHSLTAQVKLYCLHTP